MQRYHVSLQYQLVILESRQTDNNKLFKAMAVNSYTGQSSDSQTFVLKVQGRNDHFDHKEVTSRQIRLISGFVVHTDT